MYDKNYIEKLVNEHIQNTPFYLVKLSVSSKNSIKVFIDADARVAIKDCVALSRYIESNLDREQDDFELEVSSYGITEPLLLRRQYHKNINKSVSVMLNDGKKAEGILTAFNDNGIELKLKLTKRQIKENSPETRHIAWEDIKETRIIISFK